jgi:hypothetical protein
VKLSLTVFAAAVSFVAAGCFYPPTAQPPPEQVTRTIVPLPYDLTWTAVNSVIHQNGYKVVAANPNHGIIEVQGRSFTLQDADCGRIKSVVGTYAATPENDASAVFNFHVSAVSNEKSAVEVRATFASPLKVPLHPTQNEECISRGAQESRLLRQILAQATVTKPPAYTPSTQASGPGAQAPSAPLLSGRPTLLKPDFLKLKKPN